MAPAKRLPGRRLRVVTEGPRASAADEYFAIVQATAECEERCGRRVVSEHDGRVAQQAAPLRAPQRGVPKSLAERGIIQFKQRDQLCRVRIISRLESRFAA